MFFLLFWFWFVEGMVCFGLGCFFVLVLFCWQFVVGGLFVCFSFHTENRNLVPSLFYLMYLRQSWQAKWSCESQTELLLVKDLKLRFSNTQVLWQYTHIMGPFSIKHLYVIMSSGTGRVSWEVLDRTSLILEFSWSEIVSYISPYKATQ